MQKTTKEKILDAALELFSERGYDGVGIDLIAERVGIKGPSIYKHYKGKEEILRALLAQMEAHYDRQFGTERLAMFVPASMEELVDFSLRKISITMHDPMIKKARRLLTIEQFRDPYIAELLTKHTVESIRHIFRGQFTGMMKNGLLKSGDIDALTMEFVLPVTVYIQMFDRQPQREQEIMEHIKKHLEHFAAVYGE